MPDWRKAEDYAYAANYDLHQWAWEFLRRNQEYREAYSAWHAGLTAAQQDPKDPHIWSASWFDFRPFGLMGAADPDLSYDEARPVFAERVGVQVLDKWDPWMPEDGSAHPWPGHPSFVALRVDLHYSIKEQLEIAGDLLHRFQLHSKETVDSFAVLEPAPRTFQMRQFVLYLRILDAELDGATIGNMGRVLFPDTKGETQRQHLKKIRVTARQMASAGYRDLLLLPPR
jgi:hypothetical protein